MKKLFMLLLLISINTFVFAQDNFQDVVYLKNGSIIHGMIVEQVPGKSLKIETKDKNVFVFQLEEVEKITKELMVSTAVKENVEKNRKGFIGLSLGASFPLGKFADECRIPDRPMKPVRYPTFLAPS